MLKEETLLREDSIEELFCKSFEKLKIHVMDTEISSFMIQLLLGSIKEIPENEKPFLLRLIEKRIEVCFDYKIKDIKLLLFLCILTENPGKAIMYLTYLQYWTKKNGIERVDLNIFCQKIFPSGFPSNEDLKELWDSQKVESKKQFTSDNLLDYPVPLTSLRFNNLK